MSVVTNEHSAKVGVPVAANDVETCLYHESMSKSQVNVHTMSPCLYHESFPMIRVNVYTMSQEILTTEKKRKIITEIQFPETHKYKLQE